MPRRRPAFHSARFSQLVERAGRQITDSLRDSSLVTDHHGTSGTVRETGFREFLAQLLPDRYHVGTGFAFDARDTQTRQLDVIVALDPPLVRVHQKEGFSYLPCEVILAVIEVKKTLTASELRSAFRNAASVRSLRPFGKQDFVSARRGGAKLENDQHRCFYSVVAFDSNLGRNDWAQKEWRRIQEAAVEEDLTPDVIDRAVILDRGLLNTSEGLALGSPGEIDPVIFHWFVHLSNYLDREAARRPLLDIDVYTPNIRWEQLR